jgi:peptidoglycan/xylan/chitin deacetylase (PgdA/CDA1 family)
MEYLKTANTQYHSSFRDRTRHAQLSILDRTIRTLAGQPWRYLAQPLMRRRATVFMLHRERDDAAGVPGYCQSEVRHAIGQLREAGARFVSLRELVAYGRRHGTFPANAVAFTIDDGFNDNGNLARVFVSEGAPVTIFLITGLMDGTTWPWDDRVAYALRGCAMPAASIQLPDGAWTHPLGTPADRSEAAESLQNRIKGLPQDDLEALLRRVFEDLGVDVPTTPPSAYRPLGWDAARELECLGVEFGPHSVSHRIFSGLSVSAARGELADSWQRLRAELAQPLNIFAWPTGRLRDFTARDVGLARELGLGAAVASADDYATIEQGSGDDGWYSLRRWSWPARTRDLLQHGSWVERAKQLVRTHARHNPSQ